MLACSGIDEVLLADQKAGVEPVQVVDPHLPPHRDLLVLAVDLQEVLHPARVGVQTRNIYIETLVAERRQIVLKNEMVCISWKC